MARTFSTVSAGLTAGALSSNRSLRIEYAVQIQGWRRRRGLTQHHVDLPSMVRLVIEQVAACHMCRFHVVFALVVRVRKGPVPKGGIQPRKERVDPRVLTRSRASQAGKVVVQNLVEGRRHAIAIFEQCQPPSIAQQDVIQQPVNAAERPRTVLSILGIVQLYTRCKKALVGNAVVSRKQLKVSRQVHAPELTPP